MKRGPYRKRAVKDRLLKRMVVDPVTGCWNSTYATDEAGYAYIRVNDHNVLVHRASYVEFKGDPMDFLVCHSCDNRRCINPEHLWLGSDADNMHDMIDKGRAAWHE